MAISSRDGQRASPLSGRREARFLDACNERRRTLVTEPPRRRRDADSCNETARVRAAANAREAAKASSKTPRLRLSSTRTSTSALRRRAGWNTQQRHDTEGLWLLLLRQASPRVPPAIAGASFDRACSLRRVSSSVSSRSAAATQRNVRRSGKSFALASLTIRRPARLFHAWP